MNASWPLVVALTVFCARASAQDAASSAAAPRPGPPTATGKPATTSAPQPGAPPATMQPTQLRPGRQAPTTGRKQGQRPTTGKPTQSTSAEPPAAASEHAATTTADTSAPGSAQTLAPGGPSQQQPPAPAAVGTQPTAVDAVASAGPERTPPLPPTDKQTTTGAQTAKGKRSKGAKREEDPQPQPSQEPTPAQGDLFVAKIRNCYQAESGHELPDEDGKLLDEYKAELIKELRLTSPDPNCKSKGDAAKNCAAGLAAMTCADLAGPIKRKGWDRHLLPADRKALTQYMTALVKRKAACLDKSGSGQDKDPVELDVEATRLGVAASMNLVTGRCQLDPKGEQACLKQVGGLDCKDVEHAIVHNDLIFVCKQFLRCRKGPHVE